MEQFQHRRHKGVGLLTVNYFMYTGRAVLTRGFDKHSCEFNIYITQKVSAIFFNCCKTTFVSSSISFTGADFYRRYTVTLLGYVIPQRVSALKKKQSTIQKSLRIKINLQLQHSTALNMLYKKQLCIMWWGEGRADLED